MAANRKRPATGPAASTEVPPISVQDADDDPLEDFRRAMFAHVDKSLSDLSVKIMDSTIDLVRRSDAKNQARFSEQQEEIDTIKAKQDAMAEENAKTWKVIADLQKSIATAEQAIPIKDKLDDALFDRDLDATILKIGSPENITKIALTAALAPWLQEADIAPEATEVQGPTAGKRFTLQFKGGAGLASNRAKKARSLLYNPSTGWRKFDPIPNAAAGGPSTGTLFIDFDKSFKQIKQERDARKLKTILTDWYPEARIYLNRTDAYFTIGGKPLAILEALNSNNPSLLKWNVPVAQEFEIDRDAVYKKYQEVARSTSAPPPDVQWQPQSG